MTYLTDDEQKEVAMMERFFESEGYKIFLMRAASPEHIATIQSKMSLVSDMRELGFLQGQEQIIKQVMGYQELYEANVAAVEAQREDDAKIKGIESDEDALAHA